MTTTAERRKVRFRSGEDDCAAWHYPGGNGACVVLAGGTGVPKEPGTDRFARRFREAGFSVLAFDFRHLGESGGEPRQVVRPREQCADYRAAITCAAGLPEVDPARIALWGFSLAGGHVLQVAADDARVAAAIAQSPFVDGRAVTPTALRSMTPGAVLGLLARGVRDVLGSPAGRPPVLIPLAGPRGSVAAVTTPDALDGVRALDPDGRYAGWEQTVAARSALALGSYRPGQVAARIGCPLLVVAAADDATVLHAPAAKAAGRAPGGRLLTVAGGHYAPFLAAHEEVVAAETAFLREHLVG